MSFPTRIKRKDILYSGEVGTEEASAVSFHTGSKSAGKLYSGEDRTEEACAVFFPTRSKSKSDFTQAKLALMRPLL